jgi:integrase
VLDAAKAKGLRSGENPARWRGHLDKLLPKKGRLATVEHHAAMSYCDVPGFMADLRRREGTAARALEFVILTACRVGEVVGARWNEIDFANRTWTVPGSRTKAGREHRVPLSDAPLKVLNALPREGEFIFPNRKGKPLSDKVLRALVVTHIARPVTVHGFRSSFRDWAAEQTAFPSDVCEMALAHTVGNKVEAAYRRTDLFDKRPAADGRMEQVLHRAARSGRGWRPKSRGAAIGIVSRIARGRSGRTVPSIHRRLALPRAPLPAVRR